MEKLLRKQTLIIEHIDNLWETYRSRSKEDDLTYKEVKSYLDKLERLQDQFRQTDDKLMEFEDLVTTEYYKRKVPTETLDKYIEIDNEIEVVEKSEQYPTIPA